MWERKVEKEREIFKKEGKIKPSEDDFNSTRIGYYINLTSQH